MTIKEAAKYRFKDLKNKPLKEKLRHILTYYRIPIVLVLVLAAAGGSLLHLSLTEQKMALQVYCLNAVHPEKEETASARFLKEAGLDAGKYTASFLCAGYDFSGNPVVLAEMQTFIALASAGEVDVVTGDLASMSHLAANDAFLPLEEIVPEALREYLVYLDRAAVAAAGEDFSEITLDNPDQMQEPVAVALRIPAESPFLHEYRFEAGEAYFAIPAKTSRLDSAKQFMIQCF